MFAVLTAVDLALTFDFCPTVIFPRTLLQSTVKLPCEGYNASHHRTTEMGERTPHRSALSLQGGLSYRGQHTGVRANSFKFLCATTTLCLHQWDGKDDQDQSMVIGFKRHTGAQTERERGMRNPLETVPTWLKRYYRVNIEDYTSYFISFRSKSTVLKRPN